MRGEGVRGDQFHARTRPERMSDCPHWGPLHSMALSAYKAGRPTSRRRRDVETKKQPEEETEEEPLTMMKRGEGAAAAADL